MLLSSTRGWLVSIESCQQCAAYVSVMQVPELHLLLVFASIWVLGLDFARSSFLERENMLSLSESILV